MHTTASLPGSNFRLAAIAALAVVTVSATVIDIEVLSDEAVASSAVAPTTTPTTAPSHPTGPTDQTTDVPFIAEVTATTVASQVLTEVPQAANEDAPAPTVAAIWLTEDFQVETTDWSPMSGQWAIEDGRYVQNDAGGYDFIAQYNQLPPAEFSISVEMTPLAGDFGGGILIGQPVLGSRRGATLIDFTNAGMFLRWGVYDADSGQHAYQGGLAMPDGFDPQVDHELTIEARASRTMVIVDGAPIADFAAVAPGHVGLATSVSAVAFDNVEIVAL